MGARTGSQFLEGLRKTKREIWVDGERILDVTAHPKLRGGAESLAAMPHRFRSVGPSVYQKESKLD